MTMKGDGRPPRSAPIRCRSAVGRAERWTAGALPGHGITEAS